MFLASPYENGSHGIKSPASPRPPRIVGPRDELTGSELGEKLRLRLDLTHRALGRRLAATVHSVARWERDKVPLLKLRARLIRVSSEGRADRDR